MLKKLLFMLMMSTLVIGLASARHASSPRITLSDTMTYYLDGKVISSERFLKLDAKTLVSIDVDKGTRTVKGFTQKATESMHLRSYEMKGTKLDWSAAKALRDVSFIVDEKVTDAQKARLIPAEQIESVYQLPVSATGPTGETGSFGKNGVIIVTTKKK